MARENDKLLVEVKDKFARTKPSINRFLGRVLIDLNMLVEMARLSKGYLFNFLFPKYEMNIVVLIA